MIYIEKFLSAYDIAAPVGSVAIFLTIISAFYALFQCFLGYKLRKVWVTIIGFLIGLIVGTSIPIMLINSPQKLIISIAIGLVVGFILGFIAFKLYKVFIFIWVGLIGFIFISALFPQNLAWLGIIMGIISGVLIGLLAVKLLRPTTIVMTALTGGFSAASHIFALGHLDNQTTFIICACVLVVVGAVVQFATTKKN